MRLCRSSAMDVDRCIFSSCWSALVFLFDVKGALGRLCPRLKMRHDNCQIFDFTNLADMRSAGTWCTAIPGCDLFPAGSCQLNYKHLQYSGVVHRVSHSSCPLAYGGLGYQPELLSFVAELFFEYKLTSQCTLCEAHVCQACSACMYVSWALPGGALLPGPSWIAYAVNPKATDSELAISTNLPLERMQMRSRWMILLLAEEFLTRPRRRQLGPLRNIPQNTADVRGMFQGEIPSRSIRASNW